MSEPRIAVYVAREPFIGYIPGHIGNIRAGRVVVASHPGVALYPDKWRLLGTVDPDTARMIEALDDEATVKSVPMSMILAPVDTTEVAGDGLTLARITAALDEWTDAWPPTQSTFAETLGPTDRRIRQVLHDEQTSWAAVLASAERRR